MDDNFTIVIALEGYKKELNNLLINGSDVYEYSELIDMISSVNRLIDKYKEMVGR